MARENKKSGPGAIELLEEAVHLLRRNPFDLAIYYAGTGAFAVAALYAWASVTWFAPAPGIVALHALVLAGLFGVMKTFQYHFVRRLYAARAGESAPAWAWRDFPSHFSTQMRLQACALIVLPVAAVFTVPFGWMNAYFQTVLVVSGPSIEARREEAWRLAKLWPAQNHWALLTLLGLWIVVFVNVAMAFYLVPLLATKWLGLKTMFATTGWSFANTTMLGLLFTLTQLLVDPLHKAFYVLRVFHGRARRTGADIRLGLRKEKQLALAATRAGLVALGLLLCWPMSGFAAVEAKPAPEKISTAQLNHAIDGVIARPEFVWRLRPLPTPADRSKEGPVKGFVRATFQTIREIAVGIVNGVKRAQRWISDLFPGGDSPSFEKNAGPKASNLEWMAMLQMAAYGLLFVVLGVLIFVAWRVWKQAQATPRSLLPASGPAGTPDLRDENIEASRLPTDGWLELARQKMAAGEWRLALRALFLASLSRLAGEGLVTLARFKTNHDYERELRRRVRERTAVLEDFRQRRRQFEDTWYGNHPTEADRVHEWLRQLEGRT